jgi:hypothetical protein
MAVLSLMRIAKERKLEMIQGFGDSKLAVE